MNQLNQFVQQMRSLFASMTPQSRLLAVLLTAGIVISSVFLVQGYTGGNGSMVYLFAGRSLSEAELDKIEIALSNASLPKYERNGNRIQVPKSSKDVYYKAVADGKAVPEGLGSHLDAALNSNSMLEGTKTTEAKHLAGKLKDVSNNIMQMDSIIQNAHVTYDEKREGFSSERKQTAAVAIKTRAGKRLTLEQQHGIIAYVASQFAGLKESEVALLDLNDSHTTKMSSDPNSVALAKYDQVKRQREEELRERAERLLMDYGNVRVDVNVDVDATLNEEKDTLTYNDKPTTIQSSTSKKDSTNQKQSQGGRPGAEPNAFANKGTSVDSRSPEQSSMTKEVNENDKRVTGNTLTRTVTAGLQTQRVAFTVSVPFSYYQKSATYQWLAMNPGKQLSDMPAFTELDLERVKKDTGTSIQLKLTPLLPVGSAGEDKLPRVTVTDYPDMPVVGPKAPSTIENATEWMAQSWQTIALFGMVGIALVSLRSFAKSAPGADNSAFERGFDLPLDDASDIDLSSLTEEENDLFDDRPKEDGEPSVPKLRTTGGDVKNDLTALVRENPDAAATLLRNWIAGTA
jgi:flagellar M-ring protein FliF